MRKAAAIVCVLLALTACAKRPTTDGDLQSETQRAVDRKLGAQATFSLMESIAKQNIACGHESAPTGAGGSMVEQDFVYQNGRLIMDDDPAFDQAAIECDVAASGGSAASVANATGE